MNLNAIRIFVHELAPTAAFYGNTLGLRQVAGSASAGYCVFDAGAARLIVESVAADAPAEDAALVGRFTGLSFEVDDVRATHARLTALGVTFDEEPETQAWGGVVATLRDPGGNVVQVCQYPAPVPT